MGTVGYAAGKQISGNVAAVFFNLPLTNRL